MRYILSESQFKHLIEVERTSGRYQTQPMYDILHFFSTDLSNKQKVEGFRNFFKKYVGMEINFTKSNIIEFFEYPNSLDYFPKEYKSKDSLTALTYYIADKYHGLKKGVDLEYMIIKDGEMKNYYFFDPQFKILVGKISIIRNYSIKGKTYKVSVAAADEELIGKGYGTKMYLTIINNVDYLLSDTTLFSGAYRMWKHILPKYVNVWGVNDKGFETEYDKIEPEKTKNVRKYDYFVASLKNRL